MKQLSLFDTLLDEEFTENSIATDRSPYVKVITENKSNLPLKFEVLKSVNNPKSIHGIYPYRGKISALDAQQILAQLPTDINLLDPFAGSGTILYEAQKLGMTVFGVDNNPLAFELTSAKLEQKELSTYLNELDSILTKARTALKEENVVAMPEEAKKHFHEKSAKEIMSVAMLIDEMSAYIKACYYGAIALTARGCNHYKWTSSSVGKNMPDKQYINFYEKLQQKVTKHYASNLGAPKGTIYLGDSRKLSEYIPENSIDVVFTSPPYFDALDYTAYYGKIIYDIHEKNRLEIKEGLIQKAATYEESMKAVLEEIDKVTKEDATIIFVVGDKKQKSGVIDGGEFFASLREKNPTYIVERVYSGTQSQVFDTLNKTLRKEQIVVWNKKEGY